MVVAEKLNFILKQNEKNKLSHAFLLETNNIESCLNDVKKIIKIINADTSNIDRLVDLNNLPSLVIIEPDGMNIKKGQLQELENKFSTKPVYTKYNSYIIKNADKMNESASNTILKFLEEPEDNVIGFFIVNNKENILPTIKSRCQIVHVDYNITNEDDSDLINIVNEYIDEINNTNDYLINKNVILTKYQERNEIEKILLMMYDYYFNIFNKNLNNYESRIKINKILEIIQKKLNLLKYNGNLELILDSLVIEMRRCND